MCVQFSVTSVFMLNADVHDFKKGQVFSKDKDGEWYYCTMPHHMQESGSWPDRLYRDYWRHTPVKNSKGAPYFDAIRNASFKELRLVRSRA